MIRRSMWMGGAFAGTLLVASVATLAWAAAATPAKPAAPARSAEAQKQMVERGRYLVTTMGCGDCHTPGTFYGAPDFTRMLSGSELGWKGPWGVSFAANLTPDTETGLGYWSEDEIVKAFRTGVRNDGTRLLPPMPWQDFAGLTEADAHAIGAFLMSLPAVKHAVPADVPPGKEYAGPVLAFPPPPAWDAPRDAATAPASNK